MDSEIKVTNIPARDGYGQNGSPSASSDLPGQKTTSGFLPQASLTDSDWQTRQIDVSPFAPHPAMAMRGPGSPSGPVPAATIRRDSGKRLRK